MVVPFLKLVIIVSDKDKECNVRQRNTRLIIVVNLRDEYVNKHVIFAS